MTRLEAYRAALSAAVRDGDVTVVKAMTKAIFLATDDADCIVQKSTTYVKGSMTYARGGSAEVTVRG